MTSSLGGPDSAVCPAPARPCVGRIPHDSVPRWGQRNLEARALPQAGMVVSERLIETVFVWLLPAIGVVLWLWIWWAKRRDARASREEQRRRERRDAQRPPDRQPP